jgi:phosphoribosylaminoimidazolecarboxamide formyltransferase / IMP cyclohydrolase
VTEATSHLSFPYGENPHQGSARVCAAREGDELPFQVPGRPVSFNNLADALLAWSLASELKGLGGTDVAVSVKHGRPLGIAFVESSSTSGGAHPGSAIAAAAASARATNPEASIHDWLAVTCGIGRTAAERLLRHRADGIVAPDFAAGVVDVLMSSDDHLRAVRIVAERFDALPRPRLESRTTYGLRWEQEPNDIRVTPEWPLLLAEGEERPAEAVRRALLAALLVCKYTPARAMCAVQGGVTRAVVGGCQSERESVTSLSELVAQKHLAEGKPGLVACSSVNIAEAESVRTVSRAGIRYLLQPSVPSPDLLVEGRRHDVIMLGSGVRLIRR